MFTGKVREGINAGKNLSESIAEAVRYCEENQILQPFLSDHASEVENMLTTEFVLEDAIAVWKEEGREEGREEGYEEGTAIIIQIVKLHSDKKSIDEIAKKLDLTSDYVTKKLQESGLIK